MLGSGFFGAVYKGFLINKQGTKTPVAIKMVKSKFTALFKIF